MALRLPVSVTAGLAPISAGAATAARGGVLWGRSRALAVRALPAAPPAVPATRMAARRALNVRRPVAGSGAAAAVPPGGDGRAAGSGAAVASGLWETHSPPEPAGTPAGSPVDRPAFRCGWKVSVFAGSQSRPARAAPPFSP